MKKTFNLSIILMVLALQGYSHAQSIVKNQSPDWFCDINQVKPYIEIGNKEEIFDKSNSLDEMRAHLADYAKFANQLTTNNTVTFSVDEIFINDLIYRIVFNPYFRKHPGISHQYWIKTSKAKWKDTHQLALERCTLLNRCWLNAQTTPQQEWITNMAANINCTLSL